MAEIKNLLSQPFGCDLTVFFLNLDADGLAA